MTDEMMNVEEVLAHIMRVTGRTRRQARKELYEALRSGRLPIYGRNTETGLQEKIPASIFSEEGAYIESDDGERIGCEH